MSPSPLTLDAIQSGQARGCLPTLARAGLTLASGLYRVGLSADKVRYRWGIKSIGKLPRPVVSIGNLTTGGTGKTPMVAWVCQQLLSIGHHPAILTRGYHAKQAGGQSDEARELSQILGNQVEIIVGSDRHAGAKALLERDPSVSVFVLDDGFQHWALERDVDIVLIDATQPWGHGHLLPRGLMREPCAALSRADAVILTRSDMVTPERKLELAQQIERYFGQPLTAESHTVWRGWRQGKDIELQLETLAKKPTTGICGIGNPQAFFAMLETHAGSVVMTQALPDHHAPDRAQVESLLTQAFQQGATYVVITEKDYIKWQPLIPEAMASKVVRPIMSLDFTSGIEALSALWPKLASDQPKPTEPSSNT